MNTAMRKLILALITTLLGALSSGVMADTNYDFSYSGSSANDNYLVTGVFTVDGNGKVQGITGRVSGTNSYNGSITGLLPVGFGGYTDNRYIPSGSPAYVTSDGISFSAASANLNFYVDNGPTNNNNNIKLYDLNNARVLSNGIMTSSVSSAGVPEIDGALAPKVGFLLACLFLIFGRKRENTESLMTA
jgi:hypothetical protein